MRRLGAMVLPGVVFLTGSLAAQDRTVTGRVISSVDSLPLAQVSVWLRGSPTSTVTDAAGRFTIQVPAVSSDILSFSRTWYDPQDIALRGRTEIEVVLQLGVRFNQFGREVSRTPLTTEQRDGMLVFESPDQRYRFWFDLRISMDAAVFDGRTLNPIGNGMMMRRARLGVKASLTEHWYGEFDVDVAKSTVEVKDMYLAYLNRGLRIQAGNFKENLSLERNTTSRYLTFLERPIVTNLLIPDRNLGLQASYRAPSVVAFGGIHFQDMEEAEMVTTREDNNNNFGQNEGYSLDGKVILYKLNRDATQGVHLGGAYSYRTPKTDDVLNTVRFDGRMVSYVNRKKYLDTDRITDVAHHTITAAELAAFYRNFRVQGEYDRVAVTRTGDLAKATFSGWYVAGSWLMFGGQYHYDKEDGEFTQPGRGRPLGDLELAARYEYANLTSGDILGGAGEATTLGLNYHVNHNVKIMFNVGFLHTDRYASGRKRLYVGHDATGALTTNPARVVEPKGKGGERYRVFALRFEVDF
jgi:phosphate-selective porin OprO/OprP